jgi:hypothetical protein
MRMSKLVPKAVVGFIAVLVGLVMASGSAHASVERPSGFAAQDGPITVQYESKGLYPDAECEYYASVYRSRFIPATCVWYVPIRDGYSELRIF